MSENSKSGIRIKRTSRLSEINFIKKLDYHIQLGNPYLKGSPLIVFTEPPAKGKDFYGMYNDHYLILTLNSIFPIPFLIRAYYKSNKEGQVELEIIHNVVWFGYIWIHTFPFLAALFFNFLFFVVIKDVPSEVIIGVNIILPLFFFLIVFFRKRKKQLINRFHKAFEINH